MDRFQHISRQRRRLSVAVAIASFVAITGLRFAWPGNTEPLLLLNVVPVALSAMEFGLVGGLLAGLATFGAWIAFVSGVGAAQPGAVTPAAEVVLRSFISIAPGLLIGWITERTRNAQEELEESERKLRFVAEGASDMISTHGSDGRYAFVSGVSRELLGYEPHELEGSSAYEHIHPADHELVERAHRETIAGAGSTATYRIRRKDGRYVWVETRARPRRDPATGQIEEIHCSSRDVTDRQVEAARDTVRLAIIRERVEHILAGERIDVVYQPVVDLANGRVVALEALSRFETGRPDERFAEAWEVGLGLELELLAIRRALHPPGGLPGCCLVSVNASPATVGSPLLLDALGEQAHRVVVEVTEHAPIEDGEAFKRARGRLREHGVRLAIDDVGAGFSGLRGLLDYDPDIVKLDLSLSREIDRDGKRRALATALIAFGRSAAMAIVAEGIETHAELETLRGLGVQLGQGYFLARPAPLAETAVASAA